MADRAALIDAFLARAGWGAAERLPLAGDASNRRYLRLRRAEGTAVLMDAPPDRGEDVGPFLVIAAHIRAIGLSPPAVLAADRGAGLLLLEDLGDRIFARVVASDPGIEPQLYAAATDTLAALHRHPPPQDVPVYGPRSMTRLAALAYDWYRRGARGTASETEKSAFCAETEALLAALAPETTVLALRDFHAENLVWLPDRQGAARVGLLDFQDAAAGHPAYDLVSLLKDARRDLAPGLEQEMIDRFLSRSGVDPDRFAAAYAALGAQRNLRILGVFARLSMHFGKPHYVDLIPRVWAHLTASLRHSALAPLARRVADDLPEPTPDILASLKEQCATVPTP